MAVTVFEGTGILSGVHDSDEIDRRAEEDRRKEAAAAKLAAEQEAATNRIENALTALLRDELAAELATHKLSAETLRAYKNDFQRFKNCCAEWKLPCLPASAQVVAAWLGEECPRGLAHVNRCKAAISAAHRAADLPDPTDDLLVRAVIRMVRGNKSPSTAKPS
jgi:hypothetical protein